MKIPLLSLGLLCLMCLGCATLPLELEPLAARMNRSDDPQKAYQAWIRENPTPLLGTTTATFLYYSGSAQDVPHIQGSFLPKPQAMKSAGVPGLWYYTLPRDKVPGGATYSFLKKGDAPITAAVPDQGNPWVAYLRPLQSQVITPDWKGPSMFYRPRMATAVPGSPLPPRDVFVWLPPGYLQEGDKRYGVLYMHDGQQVWDSPRAAHGGWKADTAALKLMEEKKIPPMILVGAQNSGKRNEEYVGFAPRFGQFSTGNPEKNKELSREYARFMAEELKAWVDREFRTLPDRNSTALMGSSNGGAVSLHILSLYPETYGRMAMLSSNCLDVEYQVSELPRRTDFRIWADCGSEGIDRDFTPGNERLNELLLERGFRPGENYHYEYFPGADHNEKAWAARLPRVLEFLLAP